MAELPPGTRLRIRSDGSAQETFVETADGQHIVGVVSITWKCSTREQPTAVIEVEWVEAEVEGVCVDAGSQETR